MNPCVELGIVNIRVNVVISAIKAVAGSDSLGRGCAKFVGVQIGLRQHIAIIGLVIDTDQRTAFITQIHDITRRIGCGCH